MNLLNRVGDAPIHLASYHGAPAVMTGLTKHPNINVNTLNGHGKAPIHIVSQFSHVDACLALLQHPDLGVGVRDANGNCAIHLAAEQGNVAIVKALLLHKGTNPNVQNAAGSTPIHIACEFTRTAAVLALLLRPDVVVNVRDLRGNCAIHIAAEQGNAYILQTLFRHSETDPNLPTHIIAALSLIQHPNLDINVTNRKGDPAIHIATERGDAHMVRALLRHGAIDPNLRNASGHTPLHIAARLSTERSGPVLVVLLSDPRVDGNLRDREGYAAVDLLSTHEDNRPLHLVLSHPKIEANPLDYRRNFYSSCWRVIYRTGSPRQRASDWKRIIGFLKYDPGSVRFTNAEGRTVLHHAAKEGCEELVGCIVGEFWAWVEVDVGLRDKEGNSLIDYATEGAHRGILGMLEAAGRSWFCLFGGNS